METIDQVFKFAGEFVGRITKLDPANFVWVFAIALGYTLKWIGKFPNTYIPLVSFTTTIILYPVLSYEPEQRFKKYALDVCLGVVFWGFAWFVHAAFLKKIIDSRFMKDSTGSTAFIPKDKTETDL